ncbi:hypothetical protein HDU91_007199, partial [Kappamyces sp. JEL0680]
MAKRFFKWGFALGTTGIVTVSVFSIYNARHPPEQFQYDPRKKDLAILGSGWAAISLLKDLDTEHFNVTIISPRNYFLFTPLLPSCTVGTVELRSIMQPMRYLTRFKKRAINFIEGDCEKIDHQNRTLQVRDNSEITGSTDLSTVSYDYLVVATGADNATFGIPGVKEHACFLKESWDARKIRTRLMDCLESAAFPGQPEEEVNRLLHMVVVGYPELAAKVRITLVEAQDKLLPMFSKSLIEYTEKHLIDSKVELLKNTAVKKVEKDHIIVQDKNKELKKVDYGLLVWATGNAPRPVVSDLIKALPPTEQNQRRGLVVDDFLRVKGAQNMYALGDATATRWAPTAQVASGQGKYLAKVLNEVGQNTPEQAIEEIVGPFTYRHMGSLAYVGSDKAIADLPGGIQSSGIVTHFFWRSAYLSELFALRNRTLVGFDWVKKTVFGRDISREICQLRQKNVHKALKDLSELCGIVSSLHCVCVFVLSESWENWRKDLDETDIGHIYRLLCISVLDFKPFFSLSLILDWCCSDNYLVRYYAVQSACLCLGMNDEQQETLLSRYLSREELSMAISDRITQDRQIEELRHYLFSNSASRDESPETQELQYSVDLGGVLVPHESLLNPVPGSSRTARVPSTFVETPSARRILGQLAIAMSCGIPILLEGPSGSGKTCLVEYAGKKVGSQDLLKIHLGDQTDSKLLLGTYITTSTPGQFKWQPGVLTTAVTEGRWILFEDIDLAPVDVVAVLLPLLETRWLHIPSRGERHRAKPGFRIFATRKASRQSTGEANKVGDNLWVKLFVPDIQQDEMLQILQSRFAAIHMLLPDMLRVYNQVVASFPAINGRQLSIRDLIKWCERVSKFASIEGMSETDLREQLFREGYDSFVAMIGQEAARNTLALQLGSFIGLSEHRIDYYMFHHIPVTNEADNTVQYGRGVLKQHVASISQPQSPFANTSLSIRHLERIAVAVQLTEPVLLVGETGTGKTTVVQRLASQLGHKLTVMNMSQQSDSTDLLGGFKPVDALMLAAPLKERFDLLFAKTFSVKQNAPFLESIRKTYNKKKWEQLVTGFRNACSMAKKVALNQKQTVVGDEKPKKMRKILDSAVFIEWENFAHAVEQFKAEIHQIQTNFLFSFVEGGLISAIKNGEWILLDEINLATAETLECLSSLLQSADGSILLLERGDTVPIKRHPDFRLFGCMNPANDAGKRNLPSGLRSRFTEFWIDAPDSHLPDLILVIKSYISRFLPPGPSGEEICNNVATLYNAAKDLARNNMLFDGADQRVHISMRTLTRALSCSCHIASVYGIRRSLYEGCYMTFMTGLGSDSFAQLGKLLNETILNGVKNPFAFVRQIPPNPTPPGTLESPYVLVDTFWIERGTFEVPDDLDASFVLTPSVQENLRNLARACLSRKYPVLIQGPTSAGKTSIIEYLAKRTGHRFIRINNHEHTDLQEYVGGYMSNDEGTLVFQEGVLVEALRKGYWIVLDELNLAPSDVLEALNRLLDDNRELYLTEKQEVIKPHPHFMLFATQNPAGLYGGRKQLSRAFRNRFLELHFTDIPDTELETILEKRCLVAPSYAKKCVSVYKKLCRSRDASRIFDGRQSFITLRDLFRWALRKAESYEQLAQDGYMLIGERVRKQSDKAIILDILESELRVKVDLQTLYHNQFHSIVSRLDTALISTEIVWTDAMKKMFVLIYNAIVHLEPVLLIGETGCGKTTVCQVLASIFQQNLHIVNAHQNSETSDFLGSQRPSRKRDQFEAELRQSL